jgi:hypothetical protein
LKSLRSVTVRKPLLVEIGAIRQLLIAPRYLKSEGLSIFSIRVLRDGRAELLAPSREASQINGRTPLLS